MGMTGMCCLHLILRERLSNSVIRSQCHQQPSIEELIQKQQLQWFGHVCHMSNHRLLYCLLLQERPTHWRIKHDAPKKTWIEQTEDDLKQRCLTLEQAKVKARDRKAWKCIADQDGNTTAPTVTTSPADRQLGTKEEEEKMSSRL